MKGLHEHYKTMSQFQDHVEKDDTMSEDIAEMLYVKPMVRLHTSLTKVLKDNQVLTEDQQQEQKKIAKMVESMIKV